MERTSNWEHPSIVAYADWIQDSILERNRRIRDERTLYATHRGPHGEVTVSWLWTQFRKTLDAGQTWFVVSLVGTCLLTPRSSKIQLLFLK